MSMNKAYIVAMMLGIATAYYIFPSESIYDNILIGIFGGVIVFTSSATFVRGFLSASGSKMDSIGWLTSALVYGTYLIFKYMDTPTDNLLGRWYYSLMMWFFCNWILGAWLIGGFLTEKLKKGKA